MTSLLLASRGRRSDLPPRASSEGPPDSSSSPDIEEDHLRRNLRLTSAIVLVFVIVFLADPFRLFTSAPPASETLITLLAVTMLTLFGVPGIERLLRK